MSRKIYGRPIATPINPEKFTGGTVAADNVFIGVAGEVTYNQFAEARTAGKACFMLYENTLYTMSGVGVGGAGRNAFVFYAHNSNTGDLEQVKIVAQSNTVAHSTVEVEGGFVVSDTPPEDTSVLWVDTNDNEGDVPEATMKPLTFTGAVNATYDGSEAVSVEIPTGGGGSGGGSAKAWRKIAEFTLEEDLTAATWLYVNNDSDGSELDLLESVLLIRSKTDGSNGVMHYQASKHNGWNANYVVMHLAFKNNSKIIIHSEAIAGENPPLYIRTTYSENTSALATKANAIGVFASDIALSKITGVSFQMPSGTLAGTKYEFWGVDR